MAILNIAAGIGGILFLLVVAIVVVAAVLCSNPNTFR